MKDHSKLIWTLVVFDSFLKNQSTISNYMGLLKEAGFVISERHGQFTFYRRDEKAIGDFLNAVQKELLDS